MSTRSVRIDNLTFAFTADQKPFFENVTLELQPGIVTYIMGSNGSGKSTLFRILKGELRPSEIISGSVSINGITYPIINNTIPIELSNQVATIAQDISLMLAPQMTLQEHLKLAAASSKPGFSLFDRIVPKNTVRFSLPSNALISHLSGGQKQLLALMMVLQKPVHILLLDEPTSALDTQNAGQVFEALHEITVKLNLITLVITHDELCADRTNKRILHIERNSSDSRITIY
jgi:ABC-type multidrug transport system ATPase subunit